MLSPLHDHSHGGHRIVPTECSVPRRGAPNHVRHGGLGKKAMSNSLLDISRNILLDCQKFDMLYDTLEVFGDRQTCGSAPRDQTDGLG